MFERSTVKASGLLVKKIDGEILEESKIFNNIRFSSIWKRRMIMLSEVLWKPLQKIGVRIT